ncbi:MAG: hypothetical protein FWE36_07075 [Erysipelotrichales bacterium]|nr:hypothetical protein [Erysipelotrichales bacterium]
MKIFANIIVRDSINHNLLFSVLCVVAKQIQRAVNPNPINMNKELGSILISENILKIWLGIVTKRADVIISPFNTIKSHRRQRTFDLSSSMISVSQG